MHVLGIVCMIFCLYEVHTVIDRTYFTYLGLPITATRKQIEKSYNIKKQKIQNMEAGEQKDKKLRLLSLAFNTLTNTKQREKYQRYGRDIMKTITTITSKDQQAQTDTRKGKLFTLQIPVSIIDIYKGTTIQTQYYRKSGCDKCHGTGAANPKALITCPKCSGKGFSLRNFHNMYGQLQTVEDLCPICKGQGKKITQSCDQCHGNKIINKVQTIQIPIQKGLPNGYQFTIPNYGDEQQLGSPSDLKIKIIQIPTTEWQRLNKNLIYKMRISYKQSVLGFTKVLKHLDGEDLSVTRDQVTTPETTVTIPNKGIPSNKQGTPSGNLIVKFIIVMENYTDNQLDQWEDFFDNHNF